MAGPLFLLLFSVRLSPFFFPAVALADWFCFVVLCVLSSFGGWSGLLCFPSGSVLWSGICWGARRSALFPYVDEIGLFVDLICIFADKFVIL